MEFTNMTYKQVVSKKTRLEAQVEALKREEHRYDERKVAEPIANAVWLVGLSAAWHVRGRLERHARH